MITGEFYIGCTTQSLKMRFKAHEINAKRPETKINKNIFEYGIENFKIEFVELGDQERESELIAQQRFGLCLNIQHHPKKIPPEYTEDFEEMLKR